MPKVLICHHLEPMWNDSLVKIGGISFDELQQEISEFISESDYDRVIVTRFEDFECEYDVYTAMYEQITECQTYGYGWDLDSCFDSEIADDKEDELRGKIEAGETITNEYGVSFVEGGNHSEIVEIPQWLDTLKGAEVDLCGAFDGECIEDMEYALNASKIAFNRLDQFIV